MEGSFSLNGIVFIGKGMQAATGMAIPEILLIEYPATSQPARLT